MGMVADITRHWQELYFAAAAEHDLDKLMELLALMNSALPRRQRQLTDEIHREPAREAMDGQGRVQ
jgi:hypothetical protein